jgi:hypothetical protein
MVMKTILRFLMVGIIAVTTGCDYPEMTPEEIINQALSEGTNDDGTKVVNGVSIKYHSHSIVSDNNNDGIANKGETIYLRVYLANNGSSTAKGVKATFSTASLYVSGLSPATAMNYSDISAGQNKYVYTSSSPDYYTIKFTISNTTPNNTQIPINISIVDESNNTWTESFNVTVSATGAVVAYHSHSIVSDNNSDGIANKGEIIYLRVYLANNGSSTAKGVKATFATTSSYVSGLSPTTAISYSGISAGQDFASSSM